MTKFADQLFDDLMREHGSTLSHIRPPVPQKRHVPGHWTLLVAGAGTAAVAAAVAGTLVAGTGIPAHVGGGTPAYAVTRNPDGTVTLAVYKTSGIAGANARLHQLGDNQVVIVPVGAGCPSLRSLPAPAVPLSGHLTVHAGSNATGGGITVNAEGIPAGDILVVGAVTSTSGKTTTTEMGSKLTSPPAPSCVSMPAPPPPPGG